MSFTVCARVSARRFVYQHGSMLSALDRGLSLLTAGMSDVQIVDGNGRTQTPAALYQSLFGAGSSLDMPATPQVPAITAIAA
ncbi:hypothetical protein [Methylobacterium trifolii]|uniref:hypothetical protein n=1 Tax=Methylobacterium trifolii TaxID=1003092 RepID=UPI001EDD8997|nr:hypothetical protein [Methylobacterium trifolii]